MPPLCLVWFYEYGSILLGIAGVILGTIGSLISIYPNLESKRIALVIKTLVPDAKAIERAERTYVREHAVTDQELLDPLLKFAEYRYVPEERDALEFIGGIESIERIVHTDEGVAGYPPEGPTWKFGAMRPFFQQALQRACHQRGMYFVSGGFFLLLISHVIRLAGTYLGL